MLAFLLPELAVARGDDAGDYKKLSKHWKAQKVNKMSQFVKASRICLYLLGF
jgi:hypothetical protein